MSSFHDSLVDHLAWWGLRRFDSDAAYFQWQRQVLSADDLTHLNRLIENKRAPGAGVVSEVAFYDFTARPQILPVLYSQRYDYYETLGPLIAERIGSARMVLDFGCGPGILTTFYARRFPNVAFVGVDRSEVSVEAGRARASAVNLSNLRFVSVDTDQTDLPDMCDLIVSTHALLQTEADPGIPSATWQTFDRVTDDRLQADFEQRTGLGARLDALARALMPDGRLILFEKTRQLARRVPLQRALLARGFHLIEPSIPLRYMSVEEVADDGPLYLLARSSTVEMTEELVPWDEAPEYGEVDELHRCDRSTASFIWDRLPDRKIIQVESWQIPPFGEVRAEYGTTAGSLSYLYLNADRGVCGLFIGGAPAIEALGRRADEAATLLQAKATSISSADFATIPLYENHTVTAQFVWSRLCNREIIRTTTREGAGGRQMHVELGTVPNLRYLYWANTFDQRQLVVVEEVRAPILERYYQEFLEGR